MKSRNRNHEDLYVKKYLNQAREAKIELSGKVEEARQIEELATSIKAVHWEKKSDKQKTDLSDQLIKLEKAQEDIGKTIEEYIKKREEIKELIGEVRDTRQRNVLYRRYILFQDWESIAEQCHYNIRWVFQLHKEGLQVLKESIKTHKEE